MAVIANFFLMVTWLPASVVISEHCRLSFLTPAHFVVRKIIRPLRLFVDRVSNSFSNCLTQLSVSLRWLWFMSLGGIAIAGWMVVFKYPGLQLPDSPSFQLFDSSHPFEQYDLVYSKRFWFEKLEMVCYCKYLIYFKPKIRKILLLKILQFQISSGRWRRSSSSQIRLGHKTYRQR